MKKLGFVILERKRNKETPSLFSESYDHTSVSESHNRGHGSGCGEGNK